MPNENNKPTRAWGRTLSDFWLDGKEGKLHPAEQDLLRCAASGEVCIRGKERPRTANDQNRIRANFLRFTALGGDEKNPLHDHGVNLMGAFIEGTVDFQGSILPENFGLGACTIHGDLILQDACAETVGLDSTSVGSILGDRFECSGSLHLQNGFRSTGTVSFLGAKIGGDFICRNGKFEHPENALTCDGIETKGSVFLNNGFRASGTVMFRGAKIGSDFACRAGLFEHPENALSCDGIETAGCVFFHNGFRASGTVRLLGAKIGGDLSCRSGRFLRKTAALKIEGAQISGVVFLDHGFHALGKVDLTNASIGTNLRCTNGTFSAKEIAINAPNLKVGNSIYLNSECRVRGEISLLSAEIGDSITFQGGSFESKGGINLRNAKIGNMLTWRGVEYTRGELNLAGASCKSLNMDKAAWDKPSQIRLDNFTFDRFAELPKGCDPQFWREWLERQPASHLNEKFRPNPYQQLANVLENMGHEEEAREVRIDRRERQRIFTLKHVPLPEDPFRTSIRHLANFFRWVEKKIIGHGYRPGFAMIWLFAMVVIGTGIYELAARAGIMTPTHPLIFKEAVWEGKLENLPVGKAPIACRENWVYPKDSISGVCAASVASEYSTFNSLIYSLDTAIPVVNFRMEDDWSPRVVNWQTGEHEPYGWWVRTWEWFQIGAGWALSLLFVSAIGGVIRRD